MTWLRIIYTKSIHHISLGKARISEGNVKPSTEQYHTHSVSPSQFQSLRHTHTHTHKFTRYFMSCRIHIHRLDPKVIYRTLIPTSPMNDIVSITDDSYLSTTADQHQIRYYPQHKNTYHILNNRNHNKIIHSYIHLK